MSLLCYNRGCGQRFDPENNTEGESSGGAGARCLLDCQRGERGRLWGSAGRCEPVPPGAGPAALRGSQPAPGAAAAGTRVWGRGRPALSCVPKPLKANVGFSAEGLCGCCIQRSYQRVFGF